MVNTGQINSVYNALIQTMTAKYALMWQNNEIDAETYAQLVGQASSQLISLASELVQKQEQLDQDLDIKERSMVDQEATSALQRSILMEQIESENKQQLILDQDLILKQEQEKTAYTERVLVDKQTALLGLDEVVKSANITPQPTYTPKYKDA